MVMWRNSFQTKVRQIKITQIFPFFTLTKYSLYIGKILNYKTGNVWHKIRITHIGVNEKVFNIQGYYLLNPNVNVSFNIEQKSLNLLEILGYFTSSDFQIGDIFKYDSKIIKIVKQSHDKLIYIQMNESITNIEIPVSYQTACGRFFPLLRE